MRERCTADELVAGITPSKLCPFIDYNINAELNKFKTAEGDIVHNGEPVNLGLLNEKWEALALVPVIHNGEGKRKEKSRSKSCHEKSENDEYYLFTLSDNDFITNDGMSRSFFKKEAMTSNYRFMTDCVKATPTLARFTSWMTRPRFRFSTARPWSLRLGYPEEANRLLGEAKKEPVDLYT